MVHRAHPNILEYGSSYCPFSWPKHNDEKSRSYEGPWEILMSRNESKQREKAVQGSGSYEVAKSYGVL